MYLIALLSLISCYSYIYWHLLYAVFLVICSFPASISPSSFPLPPDIAVWTPLVLYWCFMSALAVTQFPSRGLPCIFLFCWLNLHFSSLYLLFFLLSSFLAPCWPRSPFSLLIWCSLFHSRELFRIDRRFWFDWIFLPSFIWKNMIFLFKFVVLFISALPLFPVFLPDFQRFPYQILSFLNFSHVVFS